MFNPIAHHILLSLNYSVVVVFVVEDGGMESEMIRNEGGYEIITMIIPKIIKHIFKMTPTH